MGVLKWDLNVNRTEGEVGRCNKDTTLFEELRSLEFVVHGRKKREGQSMKAGN